MIEDNEIYKRVTVKLYAKGVTLRDEATGKAIGTKIQWRVKPGQFILSKIDARNGAFGIVPDDLDGAIVTNDFPVYDVDNSRILTEYLHLISATKQFQNFCQSASSGTTGRQRVDEELLLKIEVPLPSLTEQRQMVEKYYQAITQAQQAEKVTAELEKEIETYLLNVLGIEIKKAAINKGLQFVRFRDTLERWDPYKTEASLSSKYKKVKVKDLLLSISTGTTPPTSQPEYFNGDINFYTPSDLTDEIYLFSAERKVSDRAIKDKKVRVYYKDTMLFVGIGSTVGKVGLIANDYATSNQQITGLVFDPQKIKPEFAFYFFHYNKEFTTKDRSKTTLPIVNQDKIASIEIPVPPLSKQSDIVAHITALKTKIRQAKQQANELREEAKRDFEKVLF